MPEITIPLRSHDEAILVLGPFDRFAKLMRQELDIEIFARSGVLRLKGPDEGINEAHRRIEHLLGKARKGRELDLVDIETILQPRRQTQGTRTRRRERPPQHAPPRPLDPPFPRALPGSGEAVDRLQGPSG
ncbi:MAG: hypothetical protein R3E96_10120 [Planctomycetota bacterium]